MSIELKGKTAIVTGASAGIGCATAQAFARAGCNVIVADVLEKEGQSTAKLITDAGGKATFLKVDVASEPQVKAMVQTAVEKYGAVDFAFNNAGIEGPQVLMGAYPREGWDKVLAVNLTGVFLCLKYELEQMEKQKSGVIVNMSSIAGLVGFRNLAAYSASKHGVIGLTRAAALEYAPMGIRVNAVCPGVIQTRMVERVAETQPEMMQAIVGAHPMGRVGKVDEIADFVLALCRDATFVTGQAIAIDGGYVAQ